MSYKSELDAIEVFNLASELKGLEFLKDVEKEVKEILVRSKVRYFVKILGDKDVTFDTFKEYGVFRVVDNVPNLVVNKDGVILDVKTMKLLTTVKSSNSYIVYPMVAYKKLIGNMTATVIHRFVAMAWCDNDNYVSKWVVDHIDCNKFNYSSDNLRWITASMNTARASHGNKDNLDYRWEIYLTKFKIFKKFVSLTDMGAFLNMDKRIIHTRTFPAVLKTPDDDGNYILIENLADFKDWSIISEYKEKLYRFKVVERRTGIVRYYNILHDVMKQYKYPYYNFRLPEGRFDKVKRHLSKSGYLLKRTKFNTRIVKNQFSKDSYTIQAKHLKTGDIVEANTTKELADMIGSKKSTVISRLNNKKNRAINAVWVIKRSTDDEWPIVEEYISKQHSLKITKNGTIVNIVPSIRQASKILNITRGEIKKQLDTYGYCKVEDKEVAYAA